MIALKKRAPLVPTADVVAKVATRLQIPESEIYGSAFRLQTIRNFTWSLLHKLGHDDASIAAEFNCREQAVQMGREAWENGVVIGQYEPRIMKELLAARSD